MKRTPTLLFYCNTLKKKMLLPTCEWLVTWKFELEDTFSFLSFWFWLLFPNKMSEDCIAFRFLTRVLFFFFLSYCVRWKVGRWDRSTAWTADRTCPVFQEQFYMIAGPSLIFFPIYNMTTCLILGILWRQAGVFFPPITRHPSLTQAG